MGKVRINNMLVYTYNGVMGEEKVLGQKLELDIELTLPMEEAGKTDNLHKTISYADVYTDVKAYLEQNSFDLIEAVTYHVLDLLGEKYGELLTHALVRVRKYHVPIPGFFDNVEVEMERDY
ncbi:dihydroneopterin aldolase [Vagococcus sp.]|uniref:dihydroneopterin aldolase n=1 Tax=Vagococcus sp. TaxID=1933889 RepID=UPI003F95BE09